MINPDIIFGRLGNRMFQGAYLLAQAAHGSIPDIFVQDPKYFENVKEQVKALYAQDVWKRCDMVAVHVRRGDYVNNPFYVDLCKTDYYDRAFELFDTKKFLVFSDDIQFAKNFFHMFPDYEFEYFHGTEIEDFNMMASCKALITANSSFSWWAAYVGPFMEKVVAPSRMNWYADGLERTVCPPEWVRI